MSREADERRLVHIHQSITLIQARTRSGQDAFLTDLDEQDAVLWRLFTVADAASELPDELKARYPEIPLDRVRGFRNVAAHSYLDLVAELAWEIIELHLPIMKTTVEKELGERGYGIE